MTAALEIQEGDLETKNEATQKNLRKRIDYKTMLTSGIGFFADAYDLFVIDFVKSIIASTALDKPTPDALKIVSSATLVGSIIGQLGFGFLGDYIGRRVMFVTTAFLCICGNILSAIVGFGYRKHIQSFPLVYQLSLVRFFLGIGIGGEYPLAATVTSEVNDREREEQQEEATGFLFFLRQRPNNISAVFSMQGLGMLFSPLIIMVLIKTGMDLENIWRFCLGIGAVPSAIAFWYRYRMHESAAFKRTRRNVSMAGSNEASTVGDSDVAGSPISSPNESPLKSLTTAASAPSAKPTTSASTVSNVATPKLENKKTYLSKHVKSSWVAVRIFYKTLIGTSLAWFIIDVTFYGTGIFKSEVIRDIFGMDQGRSHRRLEENEGILRKLEFYPSPLQRQRDSVRRMLSLGLATKKDVVFPAINGTDPHLDRNSNGSGLLLDTPLRRLLESDAVRDQLFMEAVMGTVVACVACPGYILSTLLIHKIGLRGLTLWGFVAVAVAFLVLGIYSFFNFGIAAIDLILFGLTFLFTNFGPNTSTFILPTVVFPSIIRSSCHGFSAAVGKVGAVVGTQLFVPIHKNWGLAWLQILCAAVAAVGAIITYFFVPGDAEGVEAVRSFDEELRLKAEKRFELISSGENFLPISVKE